MKYLLFFILCLPFSLSAQILKGKVIDAQTNKPLENADVFIDQTSIGTSTNENGLFELDSKGAQQQVIINAFGYKNKAFSTSDFKAFKTISLEPEDEILQEVVIEASLFSRKELLKTFKHFFLGTTTNGKKAIIENEDDLVLYYDKEQRMLICESPKRIRVLNKNLGYRVSFYLNEAKITFRNKTINPESYHQSIIFGYTSFTDLSKKRTEYVKQRNKTFDVSANPFWLAFLKNNLKENDYYFYVNGMIIERDDYFSIEPKGDDFKVSLIQKPVAKGFKNTENIEPFNVTHVKRKEQKSLIYVLDNEIYINKNGFVINPQSIVYGGYFSDLKIADMLPMDFSK